MEHEILRTQTVMATRLNKRLREEPEEDAINKALTSNPPGLENKSFRIYSRL